MNDKRNENVFTDKQWEALEKWFDKQVKVYWGDATIRLVLLVVGACIVSVSLTILGLRH